MVGSDRACMHDHVRAKAGPQALRLDDIVIVIVSFGAHELCPSLHVPKPFKLCHLRGLRELHSHACRRERCSRSSTTMSLRNQAMERVSGIIIMMIGLDVVCRAALDQNRERMMAWVPGVASVFGRGPGCVGSSARRRSGDVDVGFTADGLCDLDTVVGSGHVLALRQVLSSSNHGRAGSRSRSDVSFGIARSGNALDD
eukprot:2122514-Rhodomonas_salina.1